MNPSRPFAVGDVRLRLVLVALAVVPSPAGTASAIFALPPVEPGGQRALPYERPADPRGDSTQPAADVRDLFRLYGFSEQDLRSFDQQPAVSTDEETLLAKLLFRLGRLPPFELTRFRQSTDQWLQREEELRGRIVALRGTATGLETLEIPEALRDSLEFREYFRVTVVLPEDLGGHTVQVLARHIPSAWLAKSGATLQEPCALDGMLLEAYADPGSARAMFVTGRIAWYPLATDESRGIKTGWVRLAEQGVDVGLFDEVKRTNGRDLTGDDRELFYQILAACRRRDFGQWPPADYQPMSLVDVLTRTEDTQGELVVFRANARRLTKVLVNDADIRERFGLDHYFEIDITIPLDQPIRLEGNDPQASPTYENIYPATVCVTRLPPELEKLATGDGSDNARSTVWNEPIEVRGLFFKIWAYQSEYIASLAPRQRHPSPLFLGTTVQPLPFAAVPGESHFSIILAGSLVAAMIAIWLIVWRIQRRDTALEQARRRSDASRKIEFPSVPAAGPDETSRPAAP